MTFGLRHRRASILAFATGAWWASSTASRTAAAQMGDPVAAEALFDQARELMEAGRIAEACPKLEASQKLDPGVGTLLNLGDCLEKTGRTASAWERFREAAAAAAAGAQPEREEIARQRAAAIEPKLCRLVVRVAEGSDVPGLRLERDHAVFERALWNGPLPVDPGDHDVSAAAPGKQPWSRVAHLDGATCSGQIETIDVPALQAAPPTVLDPPVPAKAVESARWTVQRQAAVGALGVGALFLGAGVVLAIDASVSYSNAKSQCSAPDGGCPAGAQGSAITAGHVADFATAAFIAGGAAVVGGGILWFSAKTPPIAVTPTPLARGAGLFLSGELF